MAEEEIQGRPGIPSRDATITHQAIEYVRWYERDVTRCWSRWTDGTITHDDTVNTYIDTPHGTLIGTMHINIGMGRDMRPPAGLRWIDTVAFRRDLDAEASR
jgi:hypothetical protein